MKIKVLTEMERGNKTYVPGDIIDIPEANAKVWVAKLWGEHITKNKKARKKQKKKKAIKKQNNV